MSIGVKAQERSYGQFLFFETPKSKNVVREKPLTWTETPIPCLRLNLYPKAKLLRQVFLECTYMEKRGQRLIYRSIQSFFTKEKQKSACMQIILSNPTFFEVGPRPASSKFASAAAISPEPSCLEDSILFKDFT